MKKTIFIFLLSFLVSGCYVPYPSIGKGAEHKRVQRSYQQYHNVRPRSYGIRYVPRRNGPQKVYCRKFIQNNRAIIERCYGPQN